MAGSLFLTLTVVLFTSAILVALSGWMPYYHNNDYQFKRWLIVTLCLGPAAWIVSVAYVLFSLFFKYGEGLNKKINNWMVGDETDSVRKR